ncbi:MAG TPA: FAD-dependent oxidoreductase [Rugosimonospora sp.]|nr:FAD-dependent oxidoreductase [Rugosimonospora sp.]
MPGVVVVGAGLGGVRTVERLRASGYTGRIALVGAEEHAPYDRPPLSKQVLRGEWAPERTVLRDKPGLDALGVSWHRGVAAVGLRGTTVDLDDGTAVRADMVVLATGATARRLPGQPDTAGTLRTRDDAVALRDALTASRSLLIVGAGFIGAEVAGAARGLGLDVTVVESLPAPCERALGRQGGERAARLFAEAGVQLRCGTGVARFADGHTVALTDGSSVTADVVLVGVGAAPNVGWLAGTGLAVSGGIACDGYGRVPGADRVWALGDATAWWDAARGRSFRSEHWTSTVDQVAVVVADMLGQPAPPPAVPYAWSDQFGLRIQLYGRPDLAEEVVPLHGSGAVKGTVLGYLAGDRLVAVAGFGAARHVAPYRNLVAGGAGRAAVLSHARSR